MVGSVGLIVMAKSLETHCSKQIVSYVWCFRRQCVFGIFGSHQLTKILYLAYLLASRFWTGIYMYNLWIDFVYIDYFYIYLMVSCEISVVDGLTVHLFATL